MALVDVALAYYRFMRLLTRRTQDATRRLWQEVELANLDGSYGTLADRMLVTVAAAQLLAAQQADPYLTAALTEQGADPDPLGRLVPSSLAGVASDGRSLDDLLYGSVVWVKTALASGEAPARALASGEAALTRAVGTQVQDAGRVATGVGITARPQVTGWVRMLNPPSCGRCAILAGRIYKWSDGFRRHPMCFPSGVTVSGPAVEAATRRWYEGELVVFTTASGQNLTLTANHPVLTRRGWLPAHLLDEGDEVFRSTLTKGAAALEVPHHNQVPALIEDVWRSLAVTGLVRVPSASHQFHGDGQCGEVDVVGADSALRSSLHSAHPEHLGQARFACGGGLCTELDMKRAALLRQQRHAAPSVSRVGCRGLTLALGGVLLTSADDSRLAAAAALNTRGHQAFRDGASAHVELSGEGELAGSVEVGSRDLVVRKRPMAPRWDAPGEAFSVETRGRYARRGLDLLERLTAQVEPDRVIQLRRVESRGHVYSLTSSEGWHAANGVIVSNCDCVHVPAVEDAADDLRTDPDAYFRSLTSEDQERYFGKANAKAIRDGANMGRVVNATGRRSGTSIAGGRKFTTDATTARGTGRRARLTPEAIYKEATDRTDAVRLLRLHGYLTG